MTARRSMLALVIAAGIAFPTVAEAAPRRPYRRLPARYASAVAALTGVKSDEQVQAALARAATGGVVELPQGTFRTSIVIDRPLTLRAHPRGTTFDGGGLGVPVVTVAAGVAGVAIEGLHVQNGDVEGIVARLGADGLGLTQVVVTSCGGDAVRLEGVAQARVDLCVLDGSAGDALDADGSGLVASRITARWNRGAAVVVRGTGGRVTELVAVGGASGVVFAGAGGVAERCRFADTGTALRFASGSWGNRVATCDVRGGRTVAEGEAGAGSATVAGVTAQGLAGDAFRLLGTGHVVLACTVSDVGGDGVLLSGAGSRVEACHVRAVRGEGIRVEGDDHAVLDNDVAWAAAEGIHVAGGRGNRVAGNAVTSCGGQGIADDGIDTEMTGNRLD